MAKKDDKDILSATTASSCSPRSGRRQCDRDRFFAALRYSKTNRTNSTRNSTGSWRAIAVETERMIEVLAPPSQELGFRDSCFSSKQPS